MMHLSRITLIALSAMVFVRSTDADIFRWDTGEVIPGTEEITPMQDIDLSRWNTASQNLRFADFSQPSLLNESTFRFSWLDNADFSGAFLSRARLDHATLTGAKLTGAHLFHASLNSAILTEADLRSADLREASLLGATLIGANFSGANLSEARLRYAILDGTDFTEATIQGTSFGSTTQNGFTMDQLYSTANYQTRDLREIDFGSNSLAGWNFSGQDLTDATFNHATLTDADLTKANLTDADFSNAMLTGSNLTEANLTGARLHDTTLTDARLTGANLARARFERAELTGVDLTGAIVTGSDLTDVTSGGFTTEQLYSTASYQEKDLARILLGANDLSGWDFTEQDLEGAGFRHSNLANTNLSDANLTHADLTNANLTGATITGANLTGAHLLNANISDVQLQSVTFDSTTAYNQWTVFPDGFDAGQAGLTFRFEPGDFDADLMLSESDINMLTTKIHQGAVVPAWLPDTAFDLNHDGVTDLADHRLWVIDLKSTWHGDADLDGEFSSSDFVRVLSSGKFESGLRAGWQEGDWNGDQVADSSDFVTAFIDGGYEKGPRIGGAAVPEPTSLAGLFAGFIVLAAVSTFRRKTV